MTLKVSYCGFDALRFACEHWHYSRKAPTAKGIYFGVWEDDEYTGALAFQRSANRHSADIFGLPYNEVLELTRVALTKHVTPVSRIMAIAVRRLHKKMPGLRLLFSYADPAQGHHGGIYQACGWLYTGLSGASSTYVINGREYHQRTLTGKKNAARKKARRDVATKRPNSRKYRYAIGFDTQVKSTLDRMRMPYPKRAGSIDSDVATDQVAEGGAIPTPALHSQDNP